MTKPTIKIHDVLSGEVIEREMTKAEADSLAADQTEAQARRQAQQAKETEKAAVLAKLGLTADEVAALFS